MDRVLCVKRELADELFPAAWTPFVLPGGPDVLARVLGESYYMPRSPDPGMPARYNLEEDQRHRQLIPYSLVSVPFGDGTAYLCYKRMGNEKRLHGKISLGVGGHLEPFDAAESGPDGLFRGMFRELWEEVKPSGGLVTFTVLGFLCDRSDAVGRAHLGIAVDVKFNSMFMLPVSGESRQWCWLPAMALRAYRSGILESWSQILVDNGVIS